MRCTSGDFRKKRKNLKNIKDEKAFFLGLGKIIQHQVELHCVIKKKTFVRFAAVGDSIEILCCSWYRPLSKGSLLLEYFTSNLDHLIIGYKYHHIIIVGALNQHMTQANFDSFLAVFALTKHVNSPAYCSGSSLGPVFTDLPDNTLA